MLTCPICDAPLPVGRRACPNCTGGDAGPHVFEFADEDFSDFSPDSAHGAGRTGDPESRGRWRSELDECPVFQVDEDEFVSVATTADPPTLTPTITPSGAAPPMLAVEVDPRASDSRLAVAMNPLFEVASAAAGTAPTVNLLFTITPEGEPLADTARGPVAHVILALDLSASMNHPEKYPVLTRAITDMIRNLQQPGAAEVLLSVVVFAYGSATVIRGVPASELDPRHLIAQLDRSPLLFGRYTDIVGGLSRAGRIAYDFHEANRRTPLRICLLTDGNPQDLEGAKKVMRTIAKLPVDVDGLAFGADAHVAVLQQLVAGHRGGTVKHVRSETLADAFGNLAGAAQRVVAKRSLLDVELRPGVVGGSACRFRPGRHWYGSHAFEGGRLFRTDLGTLEAGRSYSLLFQMKLPRTQHAETEVGRVTLRVPGVGGPRTFESLLSLARHAGETMPAPEAAVVGARDILDAVESDDTETTLRALRARRELYVAEHRDPYVIDLVERAIAELEERGSLENLSSEERSALVAHTCSVGTTAKARTASSRA